MRGKGEKSEESGENSARKGRVKGGLENKRGP